MTYINELKIVNAARTNVANVNDNKRLVISLDELAAEISANSETQLKITPYASNGVEHKVNPQTGAIATIDYEHHEIHAGNHFFVSGYVDLAVNHVLDITFLTPNTTKWIHWTWKIDVESKTNWYLYEGAVETVALTNSITPLNNDRNSVTASDVTLKYSDQTDLATANTETDVTMAILIESGIAGAGKGVGNSIRNHEIILKQNTLYCLRTLAIVAGYLNFTMHWYEYTNV